jgi:hypothetical protein
MPGRSSGSDANVNLLVKVVINIQLSIGSKGLFPFCISFLLLPHVAGHWYIYVGAENRPLSFTAEFTAPAIELEGLVRTSWYLLLI